MCSLQIKFQNGIVADKNLEDEKRSVMKNKNTMHLVPLTESINNITKQIIKQTTVDKRKLCGYNVSLEQ